MRIFSILAFAFTWPTVALGCSCAPGISLCTSLASAPVVFVGRVTKDSGPNYGIGPARMVVEEVLHGLSDNAGEIEVETGAGTSCYMRLEMGERYLIFGSPDRQRAGLIRRHFCAGSFLVRGNQKLLEALRDSQNQTGSHLVGTIYKQREKYSAGEPVGAGIRILAERTGQQLEAITDAEGSFDFAQIPPGTWQLRLNSPGLAQGSIWPDGPIRVADKGCEFRHVSAAADGRIRGTVRNSTGQPVAGLAVQVFARDHRGELDTSAFREATTGTDGTYEINALPAQEYIVGINAEKYRDSASYRPLYYPQTAHRDAASRILLGEMEQRSGIDFVVGQPRKQAVLLIEGAYEDDTPAQPFGANISDLSGTQRAVVMPERAQNGTLRVELWAGETYRIRVSHFGAPPGKKKDNSLASAIEEWRAEAGPITLTETETRLRLILRPVPQPPRR
jgi:hypothetical protein